jgi:hypothetical protein
LHDNTQVHKTEINWDPNTNKEVEEATRRTNHHFHFHIPTALTTQPSLEIKRHTHRTDNEDNDSTTEENDSEDDAELPRLIKRSDEESDSDDDSEEDGETATPRTLAASSATEAEQKIAQLGRQPDGSTPVKVPKRVWRPKVKFQ